MLGYPARQDGKLFLRFPKRVETLHWSITVHAAIKPNLIQRAYRSPRVLPSPTDSPSSLPLRAFAPFLASTCFQNAGGSERRVLRRTFSEATLTRGPRPSLRRAPRWPRPNAASYVAPEQCPATRRNPSASPLQRLWKTLTRHASIASRALPVPQRRPDGAAWADATQLRTT